MARQRTKPKVKTRTPKTSPRTPHKSKAASSGRTRGPSKKTSPPAAKRKSAPSKAKPATKAKASSKPGATRRPSAKPATGKQTVRSGPSAQNRAIPAPPPRPKPVPPKRAKRVHFDAKTLASIKAGLLEQREELTAQLSDIEEQAFKTSQSEMSGEVGYDEDYADAGTATFERERDLSLANNVQDLLDKINKALGKIDEGSYGVCESCGEPISADRLKALPHVLLCINCKKREERR